MTTTIKIRDFKEDDRSAIGDSFFSEYSRVPQARGVIHRILSAKLNSILSNASWRCIVATPEDDESEILGYLIYKDSHTVAWIHVPYRYRGIAVATALVSFAGITTGDVDVAFINPHAAKWMAQKGYVLRFRPYLPDQAEWENTTNG